MKFYFANTHHKNLKENLFVSSIVSALITYIIENAGDKIGIIESIICKYGAEFLKAKNVENVLLISFLKNAGHFFGNLLDICIVLFFGFIVVYFIISQLRNVVCPKIFKSIASQNIDEFWNDLNVSLTEVREKETQKYGSQIYLNENLSMSQIAEIDMDIRVHKAIINRLIDGRFLESCLKKGKRYKYYAEQIDSNLIADILRRTIVHISNISNAIKQNKTLEFQSSEYEEILKSYSTLRSRLIPPKKKTKKTNKTSK